MWILLGRPLNVTRIRNAALHKIWPEFASILAQFLLTVNARAFA